MPAKPSAPAPIDKQRVDRWLWHARVVKTRSLAQALAVSGRVRLNREKVSAASEPVRLGDVLTIALDRRVRILKVIGFADRRGSAEAARLTFEDLSEPAKPLSAAEKSDEPAAAALPEAPRAEPGGRPTKKERRKLDRTFGRDPGGR